VTGRWNGAAHAPQTAGSSSIISRPTRVHTSWCHRRCLISTPSGFNVTLTPLSSRVWPHRYYACELRRARPGGRDVPTALGRSEKGERSGGRERIVRQDERIVTVVIAV
jgi:hypothetical protein